MPGLAVKVVSLPETMKPHFPTFRRALPHSAIRLTLCRSTGKSVMRTKYCLTLPLTGSEISRPLHVTLKTPSRIETSWTCLQMWTRLVVFQLPKVTVRSVRARTTPGRGQGTSRVSTERLLTDGGLCSPFNMYTRIHDRGPKCTRGNGGAKD